MFQRSRRPKDVVTMQEQGIGAINPLITCNPLWHKNIMKNTQKWCLWVVNAVLGLHISAAPLPFCSCLWAQQKKRGNKSRISHTQEEKNPWQQLTGSRTYAYCHLPPHIWKATSLPRGRKILLLSPLEERRAPHQLAAGSALSSGSFSFCATLPRALMEPVINSALYSSLMLFHSHFVPVVSLPVAESIAFSCTPVGCCFRLMAPCAVSAETSFA